MLHPMIRHVGRDTFHNVQGRPEVGQVGAAHLHRRGSCQEEFDSVFCGEHATDADDWDVHFACRAIYQRDRHRMQRRP